MLSAGLWHMLHITDAAMYAQDLTRMKAAIATFRSSLKVQAAVPACRAIGPATLGMQQLILVIY